MLLTTTYYRQLTGDETTAATAVASAASAAQELLEADLARIGYLESAERTETLPLLDDGTLYPTALPITAVDGGLDWFDGVVYGAVPDIPSFTGLIEATQPRRVALTYTGGYTDATCPEPILRDLAWVAYALIHGVSARQAAASSASAGATSVRLGDVAITWPAGGSAAGAATRLGVVWSPATMAYRSRDC